MLNVTYLAAGIIIKEECMCPRASCTGECERAKPGRYDPPVRGGLTNSKIYCTIIVPNCDFSYQRKNTVNRQTENKGLAVFFIFLNSACLKVLAYIEKVLKQILNRQA